MTKLKSKKITKSTIAIIIMGIAIVALLAFGGTFAYFTAKSSVRGSQFTTGTVKLTSSGSFVDLSASNIVPGATVIGSGNSVTYINQSTVETYIGVQYTVTYSGTFYEYDGSEWVLNGGESAYDGQALTSAQLGEANLGALQPYSVTRVATETDGYEWVAAGSDNAYMLKFHGKATDATATFGIPAAASSDSYVFLNASSAVTFNIDREQTEGDYTFPANPDEGAIFLTWEGATINISVKAFQSQTIYITDYTSLQTTAANAWAALKVACGIGA